MWSLIKSFFERAGVIKVNRHFTFRDRVNPEFEVRRAYLWDGRESSRGELRKFLGSNPVKFHGPDGSVTIAGYSQIHVLPNTYIWEDSDGFDMGSQYHVDRNFIVEVRDV